MRDHTYRVTRHADAPPEVVFAVLADAPTWKDWARPLHHSTWEVEGDPPPSGGGAVRRFGPRFGTPSREEIVAADPPRLVAYRSLSGGLPTEGYQAEVRFDPEGEGTRITWEGRYRTAVPGLPVVIRTMIVWFSGRVAAEAARRARASGAAAGPEAPGPS